MHPEDPWIYMYSVNVYILVGNEDRAVEMIDTALKMAPDSSAMADVAGMHYRDMGMDLAALDAFSRA